MTPEECKIGTKVWFNTQYESKPKRIACKIVYGPKLMSYGEYACLLDTKHGMEDFVSIDLLDIRN